MFRDIKLNVDQWTVGQLKRKCKLYKSLMEQVNEEIPKMEEEIPKADEEEDRSLLECCVYYKQNSKEVSYGIS